MSRHILCGSCGHLLPSSNQPAIKGPRIPSFGVKQMSTARLRVALADDDRSMREVLCQLLRKLGHEVVVSAQNGRTLIDQCSKTLPDLVITDNLMPDMRGIEAAAEIHARHGTPLILMSAYCDRESVLDAEQCHVLLYLVKPISEAILEAALATCCSHETRNSDGDDMKSEQLEGAISGVKSSPSAASNFAPTYRQVIHAGPRPQSLRENTGWR
jgi:DNA-binding NarL/FixJ family response regulator